MQEAKLVRCLCVRCGGKAQYLFFTQGCGEVSLPHFFVSDQVLAAELEREFVLRLAPQDVKHAQVLRIGSGEHIAVVDAASDYFECEVVSVQSSDLSVRIAQHLDAPERPEVVLVQGLAKGEKMDLIVRHATELGVAGIVPLKCQRSVVKLDERKTLARKKRWESIAKSAAMQSGRATLPEITNPLTPAEAASLLTEATAVLVCWEEAPLTCKLADALRSALTLSATPAHHARIAVVVGPEGGLTEEEVSLFLGANERASLITLGPTILRTETAGIVAPALVLYELEARA